MTDLNLLYGSDDNLMGDQMGERKWWNVFFTIIWPTIA